MILPPYPFAIRLPCSVLTALLCPRRARVYCSPPLQKFPPCTLGQNQHTYWACPSTCSIDSRYLVQPKPSRAYIPLCMHACMHAHTNTKKMFCCTMMLCFIHHRTTSERVVPPLSQSCDLYRSLGVCKQIHSGTNNPSSQVPWVCLCFSKC